MLGAAQGVFRLETLMPDLAHEKRFFGLVAGVDEVGRGPLAGPVFAAAVILPRRLPRGLAGLWTARRK